MLLSCRNVSVKFQASLRGSLRGAAASTSTSVSEPSSTQPLQRSSSSSSSTCGKRLTKCSGRSTCCSKNVFTKSLCSVCRWLETLNAAPQAVLPRKALQNRGLLQQFYAGKIWDNTLELLHVRCFRAAFWVFAVVAPTCTTKRPWTDQISEVTFTNGCFPLLSEVIESQTWDIRSECIIWITVTAWIQTHITVRLIRLLRHKIRSCGDPANANDSPLGRLTVRRSSSGLVYPLFLHWNLTLSAANRGVSDGVNFVWRLRMPGPLSFTMHFATTSSESGMYSMNAVTSTGRKGLQIKASGNTRCVRMTESVSPRRVPTALEIHLLHW